jgi:predicted nucleic acid-binding protein
VAEKVLVDAGPIVAGLVGGDSRHPWMREQLGRLRAPLLTCDAVLAEASHIVSSRGGDPTAVPQIMERGVLKLAFDLAHEVTSVCALMRRYRDVPMSLADACLVRMTELHDPCRVLTFDSDFLVYRRHGRRTIRVLMPKTP